MTSPDTPSQFLFILKQAKDHFEAAQSLINPTPSATPSDGIRSITLMRGMINSVLFDCARANRIARDDAAAVNSLGVDAGQFTAFMKDVADVRNVSEHWQDVINPRKPKSHSHTSTAGLKLGVDETSMITLSPTEIYVGPLNVHDVYLFITNTLNMIEQKGKTP
jgi:hypothetical protein